MNKKEFEFPEKLLENINECSAGGFVLFTFDEEGNPQMRSFFDSATHALAMQYYVENWTKAMSALNVDATARDIKKSSDDEELS